MKRLRRVVVLFDVYVWQHMPEWVKWGRGRHEVRWAYGESDELFALIVERAPHLLPEVSFLKDDPELLREWQAEAVKRGANLQLNDWPCPEVTA